MVAAVHAINRERDLAARRIDVEVDVVEPRIEPGDRIAQLVVVPIALADPVEAEALSETTRGDGGFGASGR